MNKNATKMPQKCCVKPWSPNIKECFKKCPEPITLNQEVQPNCTLKSFNNRKFKRCHSPEMNWFEAFVHCCENEDGILTDIQSQAEIDFISDQFPNLPNPDRGPWVGESDLTSKGTFSWLTKSNFPFSGLWGPKQPNGNKASNQAGQIYEQSCVSIEVDDRAIQDRECLDRKAFVCLVK